MLAALLLMLLVAGAAQSQEATATPVPTPTLNGLPTGTPSAATPPISHLALTPPADGAIDHAVLVYQTDHSQYYAITYWSDGLRINGFLGYPTSPGLYPAIIHNRGGYDDHGALTGVEIVPYVEAGYVAVASQYRGNGGSEGKEDFGGNDVHDVTNLIRLLESMGQVDPNRIGMFGGSRGGTMTYLALKADTLAGTHTIKAAVTVGGIGDLFLWDQERKGTLADILWLPLVGATPAQRPDLFQARSAVYWPELINAPLLLMQGSADQDVSVQQTYKLADALTKAGKTVQVVIFPGGDHPLTQFDGGDPDALAWFGYYLGTDGVDRSFAAHEEAIRAVEKAFPVRPAS